MAYLSSCMPEVRHMLDIFQLMNIISSILYQNEYYGYRHL